MRKHLAIFAALFLSLAVPAFAQDAAPAPASDKMPGLNTDMDDMGAAPGSALPPPGMDGGKVARPKPGEAADMLPSQSDAGALPPAAIDPTAPQGALPPSDDANATPKPADADAPPPPLLPVTPNAQPPLPPASTAN